MKLALITFVSMTAATAGFSECIGTPDLQTCFDENGNSYTVQRLGNMTFVEGRDEATGATWSQRSVTMGNTTRHKGRSSDGAEWSMTERDIGGGYRETTGIETDGSWFERVCNWLGECG